MSILQLNLGTHPNDGQGDDLRTAFEKTKNNFDHLDLVKIENGENLGTLQSNTHSIYAGTTGTTLLFKSIKQGNNITLTSDGDIVTVASSGIDAVEEDTLPKLGGNLDLNDNDIVGTGNINIQGIVFGNLTGNVTGQVSDLSNHILSSLGNVSSTVPVVGQVLAWNGSSWIPQNITSGVSRIIPGNNVTISPSNGVGDVTISSSAAVSGNLDFGSFVSPAGFSLDLGSF